LDFLHDLLPAIPGMIVEFLVGLVAGVLMLLLYKGIKKIFKRN
jgi:uncharacterized membrane-anchored protein